MKYEFIVQHNSNRLKVGVNSAWEAAGVLKLVEGDLDQFTDFQNWVLAEKGMFGHPILNSAGNCLPCDLHFLLVWKEKLVDMKGEVKIVTKEAEEIT